MQTRTVLAVAVATVLSSAATATLIQATSAGGAVKPTPSSSPVPSQTLAIAREQLAASKQTESVQRRMLNRLTSIQGTLGKTNAKLDQGNARLEQGNAHLAAVESAVKQLVGDNELLIHQAPGAYPTDGNTGLMPRIREDLFVLCTAEEQMNKGFPSYCK